MEKPIIGVVPLWDEEKQSLWMLPGYFEGIRQAGGLPVMLPLTDDSEELSQLADSCDGVLFTGGQDVSPQIYDEPVLSCCGECCPARDRMEQKLLKLLLAQDKPVLGICRGIQLLNTVLGGTLYQDLPTQHPSKVDHHQPAPYDQPIHTVQLLRESPMAQLFDGQKLMQVNSCHHQAIRNLADSLEAMAFSEDGLVEAVYAPAQRFVWAVQWHPEFSYKVNAESRRIFSAFVGACKKSC